MKGSTMGKKKNMLQGQEQGKWYNYTNKDGLIARGKFNGTTPEGYRSVTLQAVVGSSKSKKRKHTENVLTWPKRGGFKNTHRGHALAHGLGCESERGVLYEPDFLNKKIEYKHFEKVIKDLSKEAAKEGYRVVITKTLVGDKENRLISCHYGIAGLVKDEEIAKQDKSPEIGRLLKSKGTIKRTYLSDIGGYRVKWQSKDGKTTKDGHKTEIKGHIGKGMTILDSFRVVDNKKANNKCKEGGEKYTKNLEKKEKREAKREKLLKEFLCKEIPILEEKYMKKQEKRDQKIEKEKKWGEENKQNKKKEKKNKQEEKPKKEQTKQEHQEQERKKQEQQKKQQQEQERKKQVQQKKQQSYARRY